HHCVDYLAISSFFIAINIPFQFPANPDIISQQGGVVSSTRICLVIGQMTVLEIIHFLQKSGERVKGIKTSFPL
ncbi:hypothetical protein CEN40_14600, partial [Fischerella thermalis CCMEE 5205]